MSSLRTFIAVALNEETRAAIARTQAKLKETGAAVTWTRPESIHLTLKFLGDIPAASVPEVKRIMAEAADGIGPFPLHLHGMDALPGLRRPRVIYVTVTDERGVLAPLATALNEKLCALGIEPEDRAFKAHVTIGRVRSAKRTEALVEAVQAAAGATYGSIQVAEILLMKSDLKPTGAEYSVLERVAL